MPHFHNKSKEAQPLPLEVFYEIQDMVQQGPQTQPLDLEGELVHHPHSGVSFHTLSVFSFPTTDSQEISSSFAYYNPCIDALVLAVKIEKSKLSEMKTTDQTKKKSQKKGIQHRIPLLIVFAL